MTVRSLALAPPAATTATAPPVSDAHAALAAKAASGDRAAFGAIYEAFADPVYARLTRLLGPTADRDDALQQVFLQLHRALGSYRGDASLSTFVYRITVNVAYDVLRVRQRRPEPAEPVDVEAMLAGAPSPADGAEHREELAQLLEHMTWLTPDKRIALVLVAVEGLSLREAAKLVDATPDAVKQRVLSARKELLARTRSGDRRIP
ncbi:MAG TPA: RNA polymerase sigma factor [Kofleriaceae bacterium]|jgi:RNA polymerase sigma-70 factor (ECF subfamily)